MRNKEKDAIQIAANKQRILDEGFKLFARCGIESVTMPQIAKAGGVDRSSVYRYYPTKLDLVVAISANVWRKFSQDDYIWPDREGTTGAERYAYYLESFMVLYRDHKDILRFNQFFNVYVADEQVSPERLRPFTEVIGKMAERFHEVYAAGQADGTLRADVPENEMFSATLHLMLAAVTRYAVGLVYDAGIDPVQELAMLKDMLLDRYIAADQ